MSRLPVRSGGGTPPAEVWHPRCSFTGGGQDDEGKDECKSRGRDLDHRNLGWLTVDPRRIDLDSRMEGKTMKTKTNLKAGGINRIVVTSGTI